MRGTADGVDPENGDVQPFGYFGSDPAMRDMERHLAGPVADLGSGAQDERRPGFLLGMFGSGH